MRTLHSGLDFWLHHDSWTEDDSHIFGTLYCVDIFQCIQFLLAHLPFEAQLDFGPVHLTHPEGSRFYSEMNTSNGWLDTQDQLPAGATIVHVICASYKTHMTNVLGDQHAWPVYLTTVNIRNDIRHPPE